MTAGPAQPFYERLGFRVTGGAKTRFGSAVRMSRRARRLSARGRHAAGPTRLRLRARGEPGRRRPVARRRRRQPDRVTDQLAPSCRPRARCSPPARARAARELERGADVVHDAGGHARRGSSSAQCAGGARGEPLLERSAHRVAIGDVRIVRLKPRIAAPARGRRAPRTARRTGDRCPPPRRARDRRSAATRTAPRSDARCPFARGPRPRPCRPTPG